MQVLANLAIKIINAVVIWWAALILLKVIDMSLDGARKLWGEIKRYRADRAKLAEEVAHLRPADTMGV